MPLDERLFAIGMRLVTHFRTVLPLAMMTWSNRGEKCAPPFEGPDSPPLRMLRSFIGFFEREIRAGRIRRHDPEILARTFIGSVQSFAFFELSIGAGDELPLGAETYVRGLVKLLGVGIVPPTTAKRS
jgi:hypothetical protein